MLTASDTGSQIWDVSLSSLTHFLFHFWAECYQLKSDSTEINISSFDRDKSLLIRLLQHMFVFLFSVFNVEMKEENLREQLIHLGWLHYSLYKWTFFTADIWTHQSRKSTGRIENTNVGSVLFKCPSKSSQRADMNNTETLKLKLLNGTPLSLTLYFCIC